jgi:hypothetical protein
VLQQLSFFQNNCQNIEVLVGVLIASLVEVLVQQQSLEPVTAALVLLLLPADDVHDVEEKPPKRSALHPRHEGDDVGVDYLHENGPQLFPAREDLQRFD